MLVERLALMHLTPQSGTYTPGCDFIDQTGRPFDRTGYARFKYGYRQPGIEYGYDLARLVAANDQLVNSGRPVVIVSAPYKYLPTASHVIAQALNQALSVMFTQRGFEPPTLETFTKTEVGSAAYASGTEDERKAELAKLGLHIDPTVVRNAHVLVVDDIRITGSAELKTAEYLERLDPAGLWYLHAARMPYGIPASVENELNQSYRHSLASIADDISDRQFVLNSRVLRFIIEQPRPLLYGFLRDVPETVIEEILMGIVCRGISYIRQYDEPLRTAIAAARERRLPLASILDTAAFAR